MKQKVLRLTRFISPFTLFNGLEVTTLPSQENLKLPTLDGLTLTAEGIMASRKKDRFCILARGASLHETPHSAKPGVLVNKNVVSNDDIVSHTTGNTAGLSTSIWFPVARRFATSASPKAIYLFNANLIPDDDQVFVPTFMEGKHYDHNGEAEVLVRCSIPEEVLIARRNVVAGFFTFNPLQANSFFVDPMVLGENTGLKQQFYKEIYSLFSREIGPLIKSGKATEGDLDFYNKNRMEFHMDYAKASLKLQGFFKANVEDATIQDEQIFNQLFNSNNNQKSGNP